MEPSAPADMPDSSNDPDLSGQDKISRLQEKFL